MTVTALHPERAIEADRETRAAQRARRAAATLIRCIDLGDQAAAEAAAARIATAPDGDAMLAWVWRIEAERAAHRRVYRASPGWRHTRRPAGGVRLAAETDTQLAALVAAVAEDLAGDLLHDRRDREPAPCGSYAAFRYHEDHGEPVDGDCEEAARAYWRMSKQRQRNRHAAIGEPPRAA